MKVEKLVRFALLNNPKVVEVVAKTGEGIPLIHLNHNPAGLYPLIELHSTTKRDQQHADDRVYTKYSVVQINFHCKNDEFGQVSEEIDELMQDLGFNQINYYSTHNPYTNVTEYTTDYRTTYQTAMLDKMYAEQKEQVEFPEQYLPDGEYFDAQSDSRYELKDGQPVDENRIWEP